MTTPDDTPAVEAPPCDEPRWEGPLCSEPEFAALLKTLVANFAPRLFALIEEEGEREDGVLVAWGMAFEDRVEVVRGDGVEKVITGSFASVDHVNRLYSLRKKMHLVWYDPSASTLATWQHEESDVPVDTGSATPS